MVESVHPVPTAPPAVLAARRAIAEAKLARAKRAEARRLAREPWRDPASEHYDPLRVLREGTGVKGGGGLMRALNRLATAIRAALPRVPRLRRVWLELVDVDGYPRGFSLYAFDIEWDAGAAAALAEFGPGPIPPQVARQPRKASAAAIALAGIVLTLTACATPQVQYIDRVRFVDRVQQVMKPIDPELLQPHPIAEGLPSQCPSIAAQRRAELVKCNADKAAITGIAGAKGQGDE